MPPGAKCFPLAAGVGPPGREGVSRSCQQRMDHSREPSGYLMAKASTAGARSRFCADRADRLGPARPHPLGRCRLARNANGRPIEPRSGDERRLPTFS
jgi:hypothetical protein